MNDSCWESIFTKQQLETIKTKNSDGLPALNDDVNKIFTELTDVLKKAYNKKESSLLPESSMTQQEEDEIIDAMFEIIIKEGIANPREETDRYWLQTTMLSLLDIYRWRIVNWIDEHGSEMDFITRIWSLLDNVYNSTMAQTRRYF